MHRRGMRSAAAVNSGQPGSKSGTGRGRGLPLLAALLALAPLGAAGGGDDFPDVVVTDLDSLLVFRGNGSGGFGPPERYFIRDGVEPWSVAMADLNGDGAPELISANRFGPHVTVFFNDGQGAFGAPKFINTPDRPYDVDVGDVDGDRDQDLVITCNYAPGQVLIAFNDGQGSFGEALALDPGGEVFNSTLVDLDGKDGLDVVVTQNATRSLAVYLNRGSRNFEFQGSVGAGNDPKAIHSGDFNGDGFADLVVANDTAGVITIFLGNGSGGLALREVYPAGVQPRELVVVDLDSDGKQDLVVAGGRNANYVARFIGVGDGTFRGPVDYTTGPRPNSVGAADFDGDRKVDVAVANWSLDDPAEATLSVLYGDGEGDFSHKSDFVPPGGFRKITALAVGQVDPPRVLFRRGDVSGEGRVNITDAILVLRYLFSAGEVACLDASDVDDDGAITITDPILLLAWLFQGGDALAQPFGEPGPDPTPDGLGCVNGI